MSRPKISIISVTYQCRREVVQMIRGLEQGVLAETRRFGGVEVIVVDSASDDGTCDELSREFPWVRLVPMERNRGFAAGCNAGAAACVGSYLLFLNPDTLLDEQALERLVAALDAEPGAAAVGPSLANEAGMPAVAHQRYPSVRGEWIRQWSRWVTPLGLREPAHIEPSSRVLVDWISGACMLVRREAWSEVGPFDERFFLYFEETDWCRRATRLGWQVLHEPTARILHLGGVSARNGGDSLSKGRVKRHFDQSRRRYFSKHHGFWSAAVVEGIHRARRAADWIQGKSP